MPADRRHSSRRPKSPHAARPGTRASRAAQRRGRAGRPPALPAADSGFQARLARVSRVPLSALLAVPRWVTAIVMAVLLVAGLAIPGITGGVLLLLVAAFLTWLLLLSWPSLPQGGRVVRILAIAVLVGLAAVDALR